VRPVPLLAVSLAAFALLAAAPLASAGLPVPMEEATLFARPQAIQRLADDPWLGGVWVGSDAGLFFKDTSNGALRHYGYRDGLQHNKVTDLHVTAGAVWIATMSGVSVLDKGTQAITSVTLDGGRLPFASRTVFVDDRGAWVGTAAEGLFRVDPATLAAIRVPDPATGQKFPGSVEGLGSTGPELFVSVLGHGLTIWNRQTGASSLHDKVYVEESPLFGRILVLPDEVWIGTQGDGSVRMVRGNGWLTSEFSSPDTTGAMTTYRPILVGNAIYMPTNAGAARYEAGTRVWSHWSTLQMGSSANELVLHGGEVYAAMAFGEVRKLDRSSQQWHRVDWWDLGRTIPQNLVHSCDADGPYLAFGTGGGGATYLDPGTGTWTRAGQFPWEQGAPDNIAIQAIASAPDKRYYGLDRGVSEVDRTTGQYVHYYTDGRVGDGRGHNPVRDIAVDGDDVWFASFAVMQPKPRSYSAEIWNPGGLARMDRHTHEMARFDAQGLTNQNVSRIAVDDGTVWTGTRGEGVFAFDKATERFTPVPSGMEIVNDLLVRDGTVWVAAADEGLWRIDAATRAPQRVPGWPGGPALSLLFEGETLWVGTLLGGLHAYDPGTQQWASYHSGQPVDVVAFCMLAHGGTLYLGGGWGIERFDLVEKRFLPQLVHGAPGQAVAGDGPADAGSGARITISTIPWPWRSPTLTVEGTASFPEGATIEVRSGLTPWRQVPAGPQWSATFELPDRDYGEDTILARVVQDGLVLAQASAHYTWSFGDAQAVAGDVGHVQVTEGWVGVPIRFEVGVDASLVGVQAVLDLWRPGAQEAEEVPFSTTEGGAWVAEPEPFDEGGDATYRIRVSWDGGGQTLPGEFSSYGGRFPLLVRDGTGEVDLHVLEPKPVGASAGNATLATFYVNNVGAFPAVVDLAFTGKAAAWVQGAPESLLTIPGEASPVAFRLDVPAGTKAGTHVLGIELRLHGKLVHAASMEVEVGGDGLSPKGDGSKVGVPAPGLALAAFAVAVAALRRRR
jgi:ligand-binding sensor domain-containing protein